MIFKKKDRDRIGDMQDAIRLIAQRTHEMLLFKDCQTKDCPQSFSQIIDYLKTISQNISGINRRVSSIEMEIILMRGGKLEQKNEV